MPALANAPPLLDAPPPGAVDLGFVAFETPEATEARMVANERQRQARPAIQELATYIRSCWTQAKDARQSSGVEDRLSTCQRQVAGEYSAEKLGLIQQQGGSSLFFNITQTKTEALEAWLRDIVLPAGDRAWAFSPTPIPDLPDGIKEQIVQTSIAQLAPQILANAVTPEQVTAFAMGEYDRRLEALVAEAKKRSARMETKVHDQLIEGGYYSAMLDFLADLKVYPSAVFKGPVVRSVKRMSWVPDPATGQTKAVAKREDQPSWYAVSPFDYFPGPNARTTREGYVCERVRFDRRELSELRTVPGYSRAAIDAVLSGQTSTGSRIEVSSDSDRASLENRDIAQKNGQNDSQIEGIEFWGEVSGKQLHDWGSVEGVTDAQDYYEVCAILIDDFVIRAVLNPDPLGRRPYSVTSFIEVRGSQWGRAVPELMADCQDAVNATMRSVVNNVAISSLPQTSFDASLFHPDMMNGKMFPGKLWPYDGNKLAGRSTGQKPVEMWFPENNTQQMMGVAQFFQDQADERTLIPKYSYGEEAVGGAASTASGLNMLMSAAGRGIKRVLGNIDADVLNDSLTRMYNWNLLYLDDPDWEPLKGDIRIVPRGTLAILVKDQLALRRQEFLALTNNPIDQQIIGIRGRATILRELAKALELDADKVVPSDEELQMRVEQSLASQMPPEPAAPGGPPSRTLAGEPRTPVAAPPPPATPETPLP